jgi:hypothetical protein
MGQSKATVDKVPVLNILHEHRVSCIVVPNNIIDRRRVKLNHVVLMIINSEWSIVKALSMFTYDC